jgi:type I restriction enzyme R subunit
LQAFSRTNRILNSVKKFGIIVCFRNLENNMNAALALFGNKDASSVVIIKTYKEYYHGYTKNNIHIPGYCELIDEFNDKFKNNLPLRDETQEKDFIRLYNSILQAKNILSTFDEFSDEI